MEPDENNDEGENIEMQDLNPNEDEELEEDFNFRPIGEGEGKTDFLRAALDARKRFLDKKKMEETSFTTKDVDDDEFPDAVLEMYNENNLLEEEGDEIGNRLKNIRKTKPVGVMKRSILNSKKQFVRKVLNVKINKGAGINSQNLYNNLEITFSKKGVISGAKYKGEKILMLKKGVMEYSRAKTGATANGVVNFKKVLELAKEENKKTPGSLVENRISHDISEKTVNNIVKNSSLDIEMRAFLLAQTIPRHDMTEEDGVMIRASLSLKWGQLMGYGGLEHVKEGISFLHKNYKIFKSKAAESGKKGDEKMKNVYNVLAEAIKLKMDSGRLKANEKPETDLGNKILNMEADTNEFSKFEKFKTWSKENLLGLSAIAITIAGIIVTIVSSTRTVIRAGATALSKFARAVADVLQKFGPVIAAIGSVLGTILSMGARGLLWLTHNLWLLAIALAYFLYNEYTKKK